MTPILPRQANTGGFVMVLVQGVIFHLGHVALKPRSQSKKCFQMQRQFHVRHFVEPTRAKGYMGCHTKYDEGRQVQAEEHNLVIGG